jgi:formylglycine-generating enzyme required for sulfatase activity/serine/threonine protein kinase
MRGAEIGAAVAATDPPNHDASRVHDAFSTIMHRLENGDTIAIDELCASRPDLAPELRAQYRQWSVQRTITPPSNSSDATPPPPAIGGGQDGGWKRFLEQLKSRGPAYTRYEFHAIVGQGGMGVVHRVFDADAGRVLALKVLRESQPVAERGRGASDGRSHDDKTIGMFLAEARVTAQLDHPNIVPVHELGIDAQDRAYFTMKLVKGDDLRRVFDLVRKKSGGWTLARAIEVLLKVCDAMSYAHAKGVIHRDLKPANVMVGRYGEVYVMDWGLARVLAEDDHRDLRIRGAEDSGIMRRADDASESPLVTMDGDVVGTPSYMPPEQALVESSRLGPWSDVYAVGAILYELLSGVPPYQHGALRRTAHQVVFEVTHGPPPPIESLAPQADRELVAIATKAMQRLPELRYPTMKELGADLRAWIEHRVVSVYETGLWAELRKWLRRNRTLAATIALALLTIAVLLVVAYIRVDSERERAWQSAQDASDSATLADQRRRGAELQREKVEWVLDAVRIGDLKKQWAELWPAEPSRAAQIADWLARANQQIAKRPLYRDRLTDPSLPDAAFFRAQASMLLAHLDDLERDDPWQPTLASMRQRANTAREISAATIGGDAARARWERAASEVARSPRYDGLVLAPQLGLVPLGADPDSGLQEFAFALSGAIPARDEAGRLRIDADTAIVFVLVPGGSFDMGAQRDYPEEPNFDLDAEPNESPVSAVTLDAFFIAKHETTQAQWYRLTGTEPSRWQKERPHPSAEVLGPLNPVEQVSHADCVGVTIRTGFGLGLPTEAQWEYACRSGTTTPYPDVERSELHAIANLADATFRSRGGLDSAPAALDLDDGFACHASIGSFRPNRFGLHDMIGNVREWCRDAFSSYEVAAAPRDGERAGPFQDDHVYRGGCFDGLPVHSRSSHRDYKPAAFAADYIGVRFVRDLTTP